MGLLFRLTIFGAVTYFTIKWMVDAIDPTRKQKVEAQKQVRQLVFFIEEGEPMTPLVGSKVTCHQQIEQIFIKKGQENDRGLRDTITLTPQE